MNKFNEILELMINSNAEIPIYNASLFLKSPVFKYSEVRGLLGPDESEINLNHQFRTASITKLFTATLIMQEWEQGALLLNAPFVDYLTNEQLSYCSEILIVDGKDLTNQIQIQHLLQHRSGLADYFSDDPAFLQELILAPTITWSPVKIMEFYKRKNLAQNTGLIPSEKFHYSDTNYLILALIIENLTGKSYHQVIRENILIPLKLNSTYLEFYEAPFESFQFVPPYYGSMSLEFVNTSFDWGGGGLVSTVEDLAAFTESLFKGKLFLNSDTLNLMLDFKEDSYGDAYGFGIQEIQVNNKSWWGHRSAYGGAVFYQADSEMTVICSINQSLAQQKAEFMLRKSIKLLK